MPKIRGSNDPLQKGAFSPHYYLGLKLKVGFVKQCLIITALCTGFMLLAAWWDGSLFLPGRNVGLFEHPAIWAFLLLQAILPISIARSVQKLNRTDLRDGELAEQQAESTDLIIPKVREFIEWKTRWSQLAASLLYLIGLASFVWNTYQNQLPGIAIPYDFWDSTTYLGGFIVTRAYKLYLFVFLLPQLALIHIGTLYSTLKVVRDARVRGQLKLLPFHPDGVGGLGFIAKLISGPIVITLLVGALATGAAFVIHRAANITPVIGLTLLISWAMVAYLIPILFLRSDIVAMKQELVNKLRRSQQMNYSKILQGMDVEFSSLRKENEAFEYFDRVCQKIHSISNYPHLKRVIGFVGLVLTPSLLTLLTKLMVYLIPAMNHLLMKP